MRTSSVVKDALDEHFEAGSLAGRYKGVKIKSFRAGSVIVRFDLYLSQGPASVSTVTGAFYGNLRGNTFGSSRVSILPSSLRVSEVAEDDPPTPWYKEPLYLALVCVGCAVGVTIAVVALMCYCKNNRLARQRKHHIAADDDGDGNGLEPVHLQELRGETNKSFDDLQPVKLNFVAPMYQ
ncbi:uncharacterized protein LOC144860210 [Branchiostoma floridae x Branchiostoma japonicum]